MWVKEKLFIYYEHPTDKHTVKLEILHALYFRANSRGPFKGVYIFQKTLKLQYLP
mgnify:CR=1 FL=1